MDDYEELAVLVCGLSPRHNFSDELIRNQLIEKFDVSFETFCDLVDALAEHTIPAQLVTLDGSTKTAQGFVHNGAFLIKREIYQ